MIFDGMRVINFPILCVFVCVYVLQEKITKRNRKLCNTKVNSSLCGFVVTNTFSFHGFFTGDVFGLTNRLSIKENELCLTTRFERPVHRCRHRHHYRNHHRRSHRVVQSTNRKETSSISVVL